MKPIRLEDMNPRLRALAEAALGVRTRQPGQTGRAGEGKAISIVKERKGPNKTELAYAREFLSVNGKIVAQYEGITFKLPGGSRFTPDWYLHDHGTHIVVEVKGSYRLGSQGRAWTAFREARAAFPGFYFVWAERQKDGTWKEKS